MLLCAAASGVSPPPQKRVLFEQKRFFYKSPVLLCAAASGVFYLETKARFLLQRRFFCWGRKPPEAAAHRSTGLLSKTNVASAQTPLFFFVCWGGDAGGRRAQEYRTFVKKSAVSAQKTLFYWGNKNAGGHRAQEHRTFVKKVRLLLENILVGRTNVLPLHI